jgi:hypothetical protein
VDKLWDPLGNIAALLGVLLCFMAGVARLAGFHYIFDYSAVTVFTGGVGIMVMACLIKLHQLSRR